MTTSLRKDKGRASLAVVSRLDVNALGAPRAARVRRMLPVAPTAEQESDVVIGMREWGTSEVLPLRAPARPSGAPGTKALQLSPGHFPDVEDRAEGIEVAHDGRHWRIRDRAGVAGLRQDGIPTHEVILISGAEISIAGRTWIAESPRSTALRNFCARLLGWTSDRAVVVDQALRSIRLANAGRAALVLRGSEDLVPLARSLYRRLLGGAPFVVSDPRRRNTAATVRSAANWSSGLTALRVAHGGALCVRAHRLPAEFAQVVTACQEPEMRVDLVVCADDSPVSRAFRVPDSLEMSLVQVAIPPLSTRSLEIARVATEYIEDARDQLGVYGESAVVADIEWVIAHAALASGEVAISELEKAALRYVALGVAGCVTRAAALLGMAPVSLSRWLTRRT